MALSSCDSVLLTLYFRMQLMEREEFQVEKKSSTQIKEKLIGGGEAGTSDQFLSLNHAASFVKQNIMEMV